MQGGQGRAREAKGGEAYGSVLGVGEQSVRSPQVHVGAALDLSEGDTCHSCFMSGRVSVSAALNSPAVPVP